MSGPPKIVRGEKGIRSDSSKENEPLLTTLVSSLKSRVREKNSYTLRNPKLFPKMLSPFLSLLFMVNYPGITYRRGDTHVRTYTLLTCSNPVSSGKICTTLILSLSSSFTGFQCVEFYTVSSLDLGPGRLRYIHIEYLDR